MLGKGWQEEVERRRNLSNPFTSCLGHLRSSHVGIAPPAISLPGGQVMPDEGKESCSATDMLCDLEQVALLLWAFLSL